MSQCRSLGIPYTSFMRWRSRIRAGRPPVAKAGPQPVAPLNLNELNKKIIGLKHIRKRTLGSGELFREISHQISRRDFQSIVTETRLNRSRDRRSSMCRTTWNTPGIVWAFDDMEYQDPGFNRVHHIHSMRDLASRYTFPPLSGFRQAHGDQIAEHLEKQFQEYGPPLFLKRDNGGNLNHYAVDRLLSEWMVIPYNSPPYYPKYNGSIEQTQSERKNQQKPTVRTTHDALSRLAIIAANTLNHESRPCLQGRISCQVFFSEKSKMKAFHKRKRKEVFERIQYYTMHIANDENVNGSFDSAWRSAILIWLQKNGFISMTNYEKCYPIFSACFAHN